MSSIETKRREATIVLRRSYGRLLEQGEFSYSKTGSICSNERTSSNGKKIRCAAAIVIDGPMRTSYGIASAATNNSDVVRRTWQEMLNLSSLPTGQHVLNVLSAAQTIHDRYAGNECQFSSMLERLASLIEAVEIGAVDALLDATPGGMMEFRRELEIFLPEGLRKS